MTNIKHKRKFMAVYYTLFIASITLTVLSILAFVFFLLRICAVESDYRNLSFRDNNSNDGIFMIEALFFLICFWISAMYCFRAYEAYKFKRK